jgi:NhaP-type Na+/H+ or K+/H+ antiporter
MVLQEIGTGLAAGLVLGFFGYLGRDWTPEDGFEDFVLAKLIRTLVIYGAAGALVGLAGEPLTEGNIVAATGATVFLGEVAEGLFKRAQREFERREFLDFVEEVGG